MACVKHAKHLFYSDIRKVYMRLIRVFLVIIALVWGIVCHAQIVSLSQLTNTKWKLAKPVFGYCELLLSDKTENSE